MNSMYWRGRLVLLLLSVSVSPPRLQAGVMSKVLQETLEYAGKKFAREIAEEGIEKLSSKVTRLAARHGDDLVSAAIRKVGPRASHVVSETMEHGDVALRLLARHGDDALPLVAKATTLKAVASYGDDAATALLKHGSVGEQFIGQFAKEGVEALAKVTPQNGRRLAMLAGEGVLKPELLQVVTRYGDTACDFVWRNKGALTTAATLSLFVSAPEEFFNGTRELVGTVGELAVEPLVQIPGIVATEAARTIDWTLVSLTLIGVVTLAGAAYWWRHAKTRSHKTSSGIPEDYDPTVLGM